MMPNPTALYCNPSMSFPDFGIFQMAASVVISTLSFFQTLNTSLCDKTMASFFVRKVNANFHAESRENMCHSSASARRREASERGPGENWTWAYSEEKSDWRGD